MKPRILVAPGGKLQQQLFTPRVRAALAEVCQPTYNDGPEHLSSEQLAAQLPGYQALVTGWTAPPTSAS